MCLLWNRPPIGTVGEICFPFSIIKMKFISPEKKGDLIKVIQRLPLKQLDSFISDVNKTIAVERSKAKRITLITLSLVFLIIINIIMAICDKTAFFYVLIFLLGLPTLFFLRLLFKIFKRILPKIERYIEQYNPTYEPLGIEWSTKHTFGFQGG
jgi:ABC-type multidrug transport system fused ATPase/permease subunit